MVLSLSNLVPKKENIKEQIWKEKAAEILGSNLSEIDNYITKGWKASNLFEPIVAWKWIIRLVLAKYSEGCSDTE